MSPFPSFGGTFSSFSQRAPGFFFSAPFFPLCFVFPQEASFPAVPGGVSFFLKNETDHWRAVFDLPCPNVSFSRDSRVIWSLSSSTFPQKQRPTLSFFLCFDGDCVEITSRNTFFLTGVFLSLPIPSPRSRGFPPFCSDITSSFVFLYLGVIMDWVLKPVFWPFSFFGRNNPRFPPPLFCYDVCSRVKELSAT